MQGIQRAVLTLVLVCSGLAVGAAPAHAALPNCTKSTPVHFGSSLISSIPTDAGGSDDCVMYAGANNSGVVSMQRALARCYGAKIAVDGAFGPKTRNALIGAQERMGAEPDGIWGPETSAKILLPFSNEGDIFVRCH